MNNVRLASLLLFLIPVAFAHSGVNNQDSMQGFIIDTPSKLSTQESAENYWTEERMRAAKPKSAALSEEEVLRMEPETGIENYIRNQKQRTKESIIKSSTEMDWDDYFPIISSVKGVPEEANVDHYPFRNAGRIYATDFLVDSVCTAQFVGSNQVLMTAAHCLIDEDGNWLSNIVFSPRFRGKDRFKTLKIDCKGVPTDAIVNGERNLGKDYGFVTTYEKGIGSFGLKSNAPGSNLTAIGYPINYGKALYLQKVNGSRGKIFNYKDSKGRVISKVVQMLDNPMRDGSSGGAWIDNLNTRSRGGGNYVVGLNSYYLSKEPTIIYSPYFDEKVFELLNKVKHSCHIQ
ncbi:hypothetical protein B9J09_04500 [Xylella fastidiosa subsp. pauca]|uniref:Trypsin-like peptidase domain-containing protein n=1 Tax=Xylella fastidiosa TaxID=2371 RepID=A0ABC8AD30_XYLFS|nr:trypsin-like peptidase domain-containing protein [Xylella fastidiosa]ALQ96757.1 trypsin-like peptidase domain-containing protein [Xylella fastidiosa]ALR06279.1 trypsin-like peptidase domain-containing protein [Xylella fastidiosa]ARO68395.1 hypothetical protein B9J09_04500 [Xylella fastidiosa subsp. pauca]AVI20527.1 hypothetical protein BCV75_04205 [Xylella fastidiosa]AVI22541.1 hypothetical protein BC375_04250 [Xylella fastidiosa]